LILPRSSSLPSQFGHLCKRAIIISTYKSIHFSTYPVAQISTSFIFPKLHHSKIIRPALRCCRSANVLTHRRLIQQRRSSHTCKSAHRLLTYSSAPFALLYYWLAKPHLIRTDLLLGQTAYFQFDFTSRTLFGKEYG